MPLERPQIIGFLKNIHPFRKMNDAQLALLADKLKEMSVPKDKAIFEQDNPADQLFILFRGKVKLSRGQGEGLQNLGVLDEGMIFGYEVWIQDEERHISATAASDVVLLWLDWEAAHQLSVQIPILRVFIEMMVESYYFMLESQLDWREQDEVVIAMYRKHPFILLKRLFYPSLLCFIILIPVLGLYLFVFYTQPWTLIVAGLIAGAGLIWGLWVYTDWSNDDYVITNQRVVSHERVMLLHDSRQEIPLNAILSINSTSDYWGRRFSYGDVVLKTYTGTLPLRTVPYFDQIVSILEVLKNRIGSGQGQVERSQRVDIVRQRLGLTPPKPAAAPPLKSGVGGEPTFSQWLADQFRMRTPEAGKITYRTHWFFLAKKIAGPSLSLIGFPIILIIYWIFPFTPVPTFWFAIILLFLSAPIAFWWLYVYEDWHNDVYVVTDEQILDVEQKPFKKEVKRSAPLANIINIEYKRLGFLGMLFNYGTVYIRVGDQNLTFDGVYNPAEVQREIFHRLAKRKQMEKQIQIDSEKKNILDWIEAYHQVITPDKKP